MATKFKEYVHNLYIAESSAMVLKGVDDYLKIAREKIKRHPQFANLYLSLIHISEPTRLGMISYADF